jgi:colanic acid biosynthesis glycosyl transferase WcaI
VLGVRLAVLCPHFAPDTAPTGEVMTRIVLELAARGHELHVVTALPWYVHHRVEPEWAGRLVRTERTAWGSITRVNPFPTDKRSIPQRAAAFAAFSALAGLTGLRGGRVDGVLSMSPPLTLGLTGRAMGLARRGPSVFNVQDVFPDVAVELGAITNRRIIGLARWLERTTYRASAAVTVLSGDLRDNLAAKVPAAHRDKIRVIPNFVDTEAIRPADRATAYRRELGIGDETVVLYAGNVGFSQSLELVVAAATARRDDASVVFLVNGGGSALDGLKAQVAAAGLANVRFAPYQPIGRLSEVLATGDVHLVPLKAGLARSSVPSKSYSILAAGRPLLASVDAGTEVARMVDAAACGVAVRPDDPAAFVAALDRLLADEPGRRAMGASGRRWVEGWASPAAVAGAYEALFTELADRRRGRRRAARSESTGPDR